MRVKLESLPQGLLVCHILEPLTRNEGDQIISGITKALANGKGRIIIEFVEAATEGETGAEYLEKGLRTQRDLARKLGGDIKWVVPGAAGSKVPDSIAKYEDALKMFLGQPEELLKDKQVLQEQLDQMKKEVALLKQRLEEVLPRLQEPSSDAELKAAVEHYQKLAAEMETEVQKQ